MRPAASMNVLAWMESVLLASMIRLYLPLSSRGSGLVLYRKTPATRLSPGPNLKGASLSGKATPLLSSLEILLFPVGALFLVLLRAVRV